jgi:hypothetical protein
LFIYQLVDYSECKILKIAFIFLLQVVIEGHPSSSNSQTLTIINNPARAATGIAVSQHEKPSENKRSQQEAIA